MSSSSPILKLPIPVVDIIYSYCAADVQFVSLLNFYPIKTICSYVQNLCEGNIWTLRKLVLMLNENFNKIAPTFMIHPPFYFMCYSDVFNEAFWLESKPGDSVRKNIYSRVYSILKHIYEKIENENTCETCRSVMYYYMRIIFIEVIKQHTSNMHRSRAYTI